MPRSFYVLTDRDREALVGVIRQQSRHTSLHRSGNVHEDLGYSTQCYIALTPIGGIPARQGLLLGAAECLTYRVIDGSLVPLDGIARTVYNLYTTAIAGEEWVTVKTDKFNTWLVDAQVTTPGTVEPGTGTGAVTLPPGYLPDYFMKFVVTYQKLIDAGLTGTQDIYPVYMRPPWQLVRGTYAYRAVKFAGPSLSAASVTFRTEQLSSYWTLNAFITAPSWNLQVPATSSHTFLAFHDNVQWVGDLRLELNVSTTGCDIEQLTAGEIWIWLVVNEMNDAVLTG